LSEPPSPFGLGRDGLRVAVRLTPKSSRARIDGIERDADGRAWLKARVSAAPEKGKANAALLKLLAKAWDLPPSRLTIATGAKDRRKTVLIKDADEALAKRLQATLSTPVP
jgi:uncharacterized protein (TIGR00251 family)